VNIACLHEIDEHNVHFHEYDVAGRWWSLPPGAYLSLSNGDSCQLLFAGRPGSAAGPDVCDAVLRFSARAKSYTAPSVAFMSSRQGKKVVGDVEFHIRASDWFTHQHHTDARYNNVVLHVVLVCDDITPALRQDGVAIPLCSLNDLHQFNRLDALLPPHRDATAILWPCQVVIPLMRDEERTRLLRHAGLLRFEQKTCAFVEQLRNVQPHVSFSAYDTCLIPALAEGLGYGRNRAFFRAAGLRLLGIPDRVPDPLGHTPDPSALDAGRLRTLRNLVDQWRTSGAWETIRETIMQLRPYGKDRAFNHGRALFGALSAARADILICNIVLPFAAAVGLIENDAQLTEQVRNLYLAYPALPSNSITRAMCRQLQLAGEPRTACQQQGLHYIYVQTCREKHCAQCIAGRHPL
jgi:hypothetical protein